MSHALRIFALIGWAAAASMGSAETSAPESGYKTESIPERKFPAIEAAGKPYATPATNWEKRPVLWGWTCELPNGTGLSFGGVHQTADDGAPPTSILENGQWKSIRDELRKAHALQKHADAVRVLRGNCKDALAKARHLYFEGKPAEEEGRLLAAQVDPEIAQLAGNLAKLSAELKGLPKLEAYEAGQVKAALKRIEAAAGILKPLAPQTSPDALAVLRGAQIELEAAAEYLDAEPPARALSRIAFDARTKLFVLFGGTHMDYETNDLWVFDPVKRRWFQRHQDAAPEPRCDHLFEALGDGRIAMYGGCAYVPGKHYIHIGPARWIYDVEKNTWTADGHQEKPVASGTRTARYAPPAAPEHFMKGPRPDAAAHEAMLKALPVNTLVRLEIPVPLGGRDWGTWLHDPDRDMLYLWAGGHASYAGCDVARFHLATGRWEITEPVELPLGCCGTNEQYPSGFNFNGRPWVKKHVWNSHAYDAGQKNTVMGGANDQSLDPYSYTYDPDKADWTGRIRMPEGMPNDAYNMQIRYTKLGMLSWNGPYVLDAPAKTWKKLAVKGAMPGGGVDSSGLVYDTKRDRMLFATLGGYGKPFDGQLHALDMNSLQVAPLNPQGMDPKRNWSIFLREVAYLPDHDLFLWPQRFKAEGVEAPDRYVVYDAAQNRWVTVKLALRAGAPQFNTSPVCSGIAYDRKRGLIWLGDASWNGAVWVLRFDPKSADMQPLPAAAPAAKP